MDHSKRDTEVNSFQEYKNFDKAISQVKKYDQNFREWKEFKKVHIMKYEDFMSDLRKELVKMNAFLNLPIKEEDIYNIIVNVDKKT